jgi:hypothetical protein
MEDMLITRVKSYMQVRWTKGQQLCYQDVNFCQDITEIATRLPHLPDRTDIVVIRKEDVDLSWHVDFMVRREKVKATLEYVMDNYHATRTPAKRASLLSAVLLIM